MIKAEYLRFLQTLNNQATPDNVRKIANLVLANLEVLIPLTTHQGQRVRKIVSLAQAKWDTASSVIQPLPENIGEQITKISKLKSMSVGPFRGFARQEVFDLTSRLVLIYGPNGTGKSSFCEALEYGLLGNVVEAESKRFRDQQSYLKNAYVNFFVSPDIRAFDNQNNEIAITPNEAAYRFCFVEKNRIDSFSRIAAQAPAKQTELISTLFGLESFTEFVRNFTTEIDTRYIDLTGVKAALLTQKRQALSGEEQQIKSNTDELEKIAKEEQSLASQYREKANFNQMVFELNGDNETPGLIQRIESELQQPISAKSSLSTALLENLGNSIVVNIAELVKKQQELASESKQVSFRQLYEAVSQVQQSSPNHCPACKTPLSQVKTNPYNFANEELQKLQQLALTQQAAKQIEHTTKQLLFNLSQIVNTCLTWYPQNNPLQNYYISTNSLPEIAWWNSLLVKLPDGFTPWQHLSSQVKQLEEFDKQIDQVISQRSKKNSELHRLREYSRIITILQTRRQTSSAAITASQKLISNFNSENSQLIVDVEAEKSILAKNQTIVSAYYSFVQKLNSYFNNLPSQLVADLGEMVVKLYNAFNRNDSAGERLEQIKLPLAQNQHMEISFQTNPARFYDALHILSEGHIRCLGLSILLAKNIKENAPLVIFDDPVNAIDDDHRESIRRTLFEDQYFSEKQILLTCHGEEFFKDIHNLLSAQVALQTRSFTFLPRLNESHIRVDFNSAPRNYILAARIHIDRNEIRDALAKARQALEVLTKGKIWQYVHRHGDGNLSLKLRSAKAPIELRNLAEQLKSKINSGNFTDPQKNFIFSPLDALLGLNGESREWRYLNKGTHEENDRAEFDRHTVEEIIVNLESLDFALA
ncbi:AAA family ATPase [Cellvibrio sp. PSBB023]|uniref:AAA family ATPase n=1 Tax=Cellvibrio sp. PSBB023 TaxID=1945512 RepID=UPI00098EE6AF|nr:AAA family ATPase [Cellvibrio sp. PSBB023]AQT62166.1 chromosome segregation protein SMC [Cellvibrio sp. PSBB023]